MPRQQKPGLSYFPLDVDFFTDNKIRILRARFGNNGIAVYIYLLCEIYKKGYYMEWNDDFKFILAADLNLSDGFIEQVLTFLLERSLLDSTLFKSDTILTSPGIQKRYQLAVKERAKKTPVVIKGFWLLEADETEPFIKVNPSFHSSRKNEDNSWKNNDNSRKNDTKKSKEKKSKEKEIKVNKENGVAAEAATMFTPESFEMICVNTLIHSCLEGFPGSRVPVTDEEKSQWCVHIERMLRIDHRTPEQIRAALEYAVTNQFWKANIRSTKKFREKFETLYMQSQSGRTAARATDDKAERLRRWAENG